MGRGEKERRCMSGNYLDGDLVVSMCVRVCACICT